MKTIIIHDVTGSSILKVKLVGEGADDAGGVFDDTITEICEELVNGTMDLFIATPNGRNEVGFNRDR